MNYNLKVPTMQYCIISRKYQGQNKLNIAYLFSSTAITNNVCNISIYIIPNFCFKIVTLLLNYGLILYLNICNVCFMYLNFC